VEKHLRATFNGIFFWNNDRGRIFEIVNEADQVNHYSSSFELDWERKKLNWIETNDFLPARASNMLVDQLHPEKIVFTYELEDIEMHPVGVCLQLCEVKNGQIYKYRSRRVISESCDDMQSLFDGKRYSFEHRDFRGRFDTPSIRVTDLRSDSMGSSFDLEWHSSNFRVLYSMNKPISCWIRDRFYTVVKFEESEKLGIAWTTGCEAPEWTSVKFITSERIIKLQFAVKEGILLIQTTADKCIIGKDKERRVQHTFHRIPLKKPELLSSLAWCSLVQMKSKMKDVVDPYKEARKFLPLNSQIHYPFD